MKALLVPGQGTISEQLLCRDSIQKKRWISFAESSLEEPLTIKSLQKHDAYSAAIVANSLAVFEEYCGLGGSLNAVAGYSVGQFGALAIARSLSFEEAITAVVRRARIMQRCLIPNCAMLSIIGITREKLIAILEDVNAEFTDPNDRVFISNINSLTNFTVAGKKESLLRCNDKAMKMDCQASRILDVEGAWHSPLQLCAHEDYKALLDTLHLKKPTTIFVCNVTGLPVSDPVQIKRQLLQHLSSPVQWYQTISTLKNLGTTAYIQCGCGDQLSKMLFFMGVRCSYKMSKKEEIKVCAAL